MKQYEVKNIRNIAVTGHLGSGKTTFMESVLYVTNAKEKKGSVEEKNTTSDYLPEERTRLSSLSTALIPVEHGKYKFNFLDTPGSEEFLNEFNQALSVVKGAVLVVDGTKGIDIGTERVLTELNTANIPTVIYINKMDKENINFEELLVSLREMIGYQALPFLWPTGQGEDFKGYVDLINMKHRVLDGDKVVDEPLTEELQAVVDEYRTKIVESVAETNEALFDKYLSGEELTYEEICTGLRQGVLDGDLKPIVLGSALKDIGVLDVLEMIGQFMPAPDDLKPVEGINPTTKETVIRETKASEPFSGYVWKTTVDPFIGTVNFIKVFSGVLKANSEIFIGNKDKVQKIGPLYTLRGKEQLEMQSLTAGEIGAVVKADSLATGDTICDAKNPIVYKGPEIPTPTIYVAIHPKNKQDEDKLSSALQRLNIEDPSFEVKRNPETAQLLIGGQGMNHIGFILDKMRNMFKVDVSIADQKIVYRETIRTTAEAEGRHKKQSGGSGQFGVVMMRFEPLNSNESDFEFEERIHGGSVPKNYHPAVEKGLVETLQKGFLAGYPVIGVKAILLDGSYHAVDSNEISFKLAASLAFKNAWEKCKPALLEPVMKAEIIVKDDYVGDVMGDINKRRGRVLGIDPLGDGRQKIMAEVPEAEITKYTIDLKGMTQGSGLFTREFIRYEEVPDHLTERIIKEAESDRK